MYGQVRTGSKLFAIATHHKVDARKDQNGFVSAPMGICQPSAQNRGEVARALKQIDLSGSKSRSAAHNPCQVYDHVCRQPAQDFQVIMYVVDKVAGTLRSDYWILLQSC